MVVDVVTYHVKKGKEKEFERHQEEWAGLMRRARGFIAQILLRNAEDPAEYHAEVRWVNRDYRDRFFAHEDRDSQALVQKSAAILEGPPAHRLLEPI
jgi:heme-degrading monooxygenase HmoA